MKLFRCLSTIFGSVFAVVTATTILLSVQAHVAQAKGQILTKTTVKYFVASYPAVKSIARKHAEAKSTALGNAKDHLAALIEIASDEAAIQDVETAVKEYGFESAKQWLSVAESVGRAYAHVKTGGLTSKAERKVQKAIAKIEKNSLLSDKQKTKLIDAIREGAGFVMEPPPPENVAAVEPMMAEIEAVIQ